MALPFSVCVYRGNGKGKGGEGAPSGEKKEGEGGEGEGMVVFHSCSISIISKQLIPSAES